MEREVVIYYTNGTHTTFHLVEPITRFLDGPHGAEKIVEFILEQLTPHTTMGYTEGRWVQVDFKEGKLYMVPGQIAMILLKTAEGA